MKDNLDLRWLIIPALFLMSFTLETTAIFDSLVNYRGLLSSVVGGYFLTSLALYVCARTLFPLQRDLMIGLIAAGAAPCTLASAVIFTRLCKGNDALALAITILSNVSCFIFSALILFILLGGAAAPSFTGIMKKMFVVNVIPVTTGQILRIWLSPYGDRLKPLIGRFCQICIFLVVLISVSHASRTAAHAEVSGHGLTGMSLLLLILSVGFAHLVALFGCGFLGRAMGAPGGDIVAVMFGGSHKSLPVGIYICEMLALEGPQEALPFLSLPILIYHATQLVIDSFAMGPIEKYAGG